MKRIAIFLWIATCAFAVDPSVYLNQRIALDNHRWGTFYLALQLMEERGVKTIVETGTARDGNKNFAGDGGSSILYSLWAKDHGAAFYSVDISADNLSKSRRGVASALGVKKKKLPGYLHFVCSDSIAFLEQFRGPIDFLYLDSYDFDFQDPKPSQEHHLREIQAAYHALTPRTIILIDDCDLPEGGKGKLVIEFLQEKGWIIAKAGYQVLLVYPGAHL